MPKNVAFPVSTAAVDGLPRRHLVGQGVVVVKLVATYVHLVAAVRVVAHVEDDEIDDDAGHVVRADVERQADGPRFVGYGDGFGRLLKLAAGLPWSLR